MKLSHDNPTQPDVPALREPDLSRLTQYGADQTTRLVCRAKDSALTVQSVHDEGTLAHLLKAPVQSPALLPAGM